MAKILNLVLSLNMALLYLSGNEKEIVYLFLVCQFVFKSLKTDFAFVLPNTLLLKTNQNYLRDSHPFQSTLAFLM